MSVVRGLVSVVVNGILGPFAATDAPGALAATPSVWSLLAFVRREFENAFAAPSLTDKRVDAQTTSETRTLVLSAFPAEADAVLARTTLDPNPAVVVDGHHFYFGSLGGEKVIVAMTGIGMVNATQTTEIALDHFTPESGIAIGAIVFSGVAGGCGRTEIGSVAVPARWTSDDGATWHAVDSGMLSAANTLNVDLLSSDSIGDPACFCGLLAGPQIDLNRKPQLFVGGDGSSDDNNNGTAFPSIPSIPLVGDIFGSQPCAAPDFSLLFTGNFFKALVPFLAKGTPQQSHGSIGGRGSGRRCGRPGDRGGAAGRRCARHSVPRRPRHVRRAGRPAQPAELPIHVCRLQADCSGQRRHRHRGLPA
jgi:hypothetical protein